MKMTERSQQVWAQFNESVEIMSVLDHSLKAARSAVSAVSWPEEHSTMRPFYQQMAEANNLLTAAHAAMETAARGLLQEQHVTTLHALAIAACQRAVEAMAFAINKKGDVNGAQQYHDCFKSALDTSSAPTQE